MTAGEPATDWEAWVAMPRPSDDDGQPLADPGANTGALITAMEERTELIIEIVRGLTDARRRDEDEG